MHNFANSLTLYTSHALNDQLIDLLANYSLFRFLFLFTLVLTLYDFEASPRAFLNRKKHRSTTLLLTLAQRVRRSWCC